VTAAATSFLGLDEDTGPDVTAPRRQNDAELLADLKGVFRRDWDNHPRSRQRAIGPSEVGHPCARRMAAKLLEFDRINPEGDPLPAWLGTAGHAKFEHSVHTDNERIINERAADEAENGAHATARCTFLGDLTGDGDPMAVGRWFTERRVTIRPSLSGTCDLYDTWTNTVIDLKFPGATRARYYQVNGPSPEYRVQAHCYGRGYRNEGFPVDRVAIWFIPRGGYLAKSFVWSETYDDQVVDDTLAKIDNVILLLDELRIEEFPALLSVVPKTVHDCQFCPFFTPRPDPLGRPQACTGGAR